MVTIYLVYLLSLGVPAPSVSPIHTTTCSRTVEQDPILDLMVYLGVDVLNIKKVAPHFPNYKTWNVEAKGDAAYETAFRQWVKDYTNEFLAFARLPEIAAKNYAWDAIGFPNPYSNQEHLSGLSQAVAKVMSAERLNEVAPNFPKETFSGDLVADRLAYAEVLYQWMDVYADEYEALLNAPEIMAQKPADSREYVRIGRKTVIPEFMRYTDIEYKKPTQDEGESNESFAYRLQHWYFVFCPMDYLRIYGRMPELPADFDLNAYKETFWRGLKAVESAEDSNKGNHNHSEHQHD